MPVYITIPFITNLSINVNIQRILQNTLHHKADRSLAIMNNTEEYPIFTRRQADSTIARYTSNGISPAIFVHK